MPNYESQPADVAPDIRYINAMQAHIRRKAQANEGWAKQVWGRKALGKMILTSQIESAEKDLLAPLDFEPENVMIDSEPPDPVWPDVDEEGEGGIAT